MPVYEYVCKECGQTFEKMVRFNEADLAPECPAFGSHETTRKLSKIAAPTFSTSSSSGCASTGSRFR